MLMRRFKLSMIALSLAIFLSGCMTEYVYIKPEYPSISEPREVQYTPGAKIRKGCLFLYENNTSLCGNDLKVILTTIGDLRTNDATFRKNIASYNDFVKQKREEQSKYK